MVVEQRKDKNMQQGGEIQLHISCNVLGEFIEVKWELEIRIEKNQLILIGFQLSNKKDF